MSFFHCPLSNRKRPSAVSLTSTPCSHPNNLLPVQSHVTNGTYERNFTVCAAPFHKAYNDTKNIVQWIELNRILGAEHFVFYNYSATVFIDRVLEFYREKGLVTVVQWNVSRLLNETVMHYYGQHAAMNDCLMRVKNITQFVVNCDLDEYLVPHSNISTWHQIVELHPKFGGYLFLNSFFWLNWTNTQKEFAKKQSALKHNLYTILKHQRESKTYRATDRSKYFCRSNVTESMGTHEIFSMTGGWRTYNLAPNEGLLHHYRIMIREESQKVKEITDISVFEKYREQLIENVLKIHSAMMGETD